jgi:cytochrome c biogenesis protein CcmG/thiol:disulfide interchange protein DsbE
VSAQPQPETEAPNDGANRAAPRDHRRVYLSLFLFLVLVASLVSNHIQTAHSDPVKPIASRKPMPAILLPQLGGGVWSLADHRGQVVLINYWATWCEPCRDELPGLIQLAHDTSTQPIAIVGVALDNGPHPQPTVQSFVRRFRIPYTIAIPATLADRAMGDTGIPTTAR